MKPRGFLTRGFGFAISDFGPSARNRKRNRCGNRSCPENRKNELGNPVKILWTEIFCRSAQKKASFMKKFGVYKMASKTLSRYSGCTSYTVGCHTALRHLVGGKLSEIVFK